MVHEEYVQRCTSVVKKVIENSYGIALTSQEIEEIQKDILKLRSLDELANDFVGSCAFVDAAKNWQRKYGAPSFNSSLEEIRLFKINRVKILRGD